MKSEQAVLPNPCLEEEDHLKMLWQFKYLGTKIINTNEFIMKWREE
jgi:hypothetical protein